MNFLASKNMSLFCFFLNCTFAFYAFINQDLRNLFKKQKYSSKLVSINSHEYKKIKPRILNEYLKTNANDENMKYVYSLSKILRISKAAFIKSMTSFKGLPHRYEIFLKKRI